MCENKNLLFRRSLSELSLRARNSIPDCLLLFLAEPLPGLHPGSSNDVDPEQHNLVHRVLVIELYVAIPPLLAGIRPHLLVDTSHGSILAEVLLQIVISYVISQTLK